MNIRSILDKGVIWISTKKEKALVGKVGWCDGKTLGLSKGHYVFIRRVYGKKCSVNTFSSIKKKNGKFDYPKLNYIENGTIYPIPTQDLTLPRFSGVQKNVIKNVPISSVQDIGKHSLKRRHHNYIQKYVKK